MLDDSPVVTIKFDELFKQTTHINDILLVKHKAKILLRVSPNDVLWVTQLSRGHQVLREKGEC